MSSSCAIPNSSSLLLIASSFPSSSSSSRRRRCPPATLSVGYGRGFPRSSSCIVPSAKRNGNHGNKGKPWWKRFFLEDEGNWLGLRDEDMELDAGDAGEEEEEGDKFEAWRRRAEAIVELREARADAMNEEERMWEDWVVDEEGDGLSWGDDGRGGSGGGGVSGFELEGLRDERGIVERAGDFIVGRRRVEDEGDDDDMLYEDRVFKYASTNSVRVVDCLLCVLACSEELDSDVIISLGMRLLIS